MSSKSIVVLLISSHLIIFCCLLETFNQLFPTQKKPVLNVLPKSPRRTWTNLHLPSMPCHNSLPWQGLTKILTLCSCDCHKSIFPWISFQTTPAPHAFASLVRDKVFLLSAGALADYLQSSWQFSEQRDCSTLWKTVVYSCLGSFIERDCKWSFTPRLRTCAIVCMRF